VLVRTRLMQTLAKNKRVLACSRLFGSIDQYRKDKFSSRVARTLAFGASGSRSDGRPQRERRSQMNAPTAPADAFYRETGRSVICINHPREARRLLHRVGPSSHVTLTSSKVLPT